MRKYHIVLTNGVERDLTADSAEVGRAGELLVTNQAGDTVVIYGAGAWSYVEVEARDDRG